MRESRAAADADAAAARARRDLQNAEDQIQALRDLLRAQELKVYLLHLTSNSLLVALHGRNRQGCRRENFCSFPNFLIQ